MIDRTNTHQTRRERGFVLVATAVSIVALIGMLGLAVDIGHIYIVKNEAQTFVDLTAIAATRQLDGTSDGVNRARSTMTSSALKWNFATQSFTNSTISFSTDAVTWTDGSGDDTYVKNIKYVLVTTSTPVSLYFIPVLVAPPPGSGLLLISYTTNVSAHAAAGQMLISTFAPGGPGVLPFAPLAHDPTDPNFGFNVGDTITLRWPSSTNGNKSYCSADDSPQWIAQSTIGGGSDRGYIQDTSSSAIRLAIEDDVITYTVTLGQPVTMTGGVKATQAQSLLNRANQDLDTTSTTYSQYLTTIHNERRTGVVPIVNANDNFRVLGFAKVFLPMSEDQSGNKSLCAQYVGPYDLIGGSSTAGNGTGHGVFQVNLLQ